MTFLQRPRSALLAILLGLTLNGCSSSSGDSDDTTVSGTASAPSGAVALFESKPALLAALDFVLGSASATITGLEPVTGATVELIRVDNNGNQVGDVLATTVTSLTGDYDLRLPAGVDLAGNLLVRITGTGGAEMRAQVVEQSIDITPVSEFVLRKFIEQGSDLQSLVTDSVVRLTGQVEQFDLTATADLASMLDSLEEQTGDFVESQIDILTSTPGNGAAIAGAYRFVAYDWGLHDDDQQYGVGTFSTDLEVADFTVTDGGSGAVTLAETALETAYTNQTSFTQSPTWLSFFVDIETDGETETARLDDQGVLSIETEFEEDIEGDFGWREPPSVMRLQKTKNNNLFIGTDSSASVRYLTVDTNGDDLKDAIDPSQREGDEVFQGWTFLAQTPGNATASDIDGDFGRILIATSLTDAGGTEIETERSTMSFNGAGATVDIGAAQNHLLSRSGYTGSSPAADNGLAFTVAADGDLLTLGGENVDGFVNAAFDFLMITDADSVDDANPNDERFSQVDFEATLAVKLPTSQLDLSNREYRVFFVGLSLGATSATLATAKFDSTFAMNNDGTSGTLNAPLLEVEKATLFADVVADNEDMSEDLPGTVSVAGNGATTITVSATDGAFTLDGYFSHDGSLGIFQSRFVETGSVNPDELGLLILVEI